MDRNVNVSSEGKTKAVKDCERKATIDLVCYSWNPRRNPRTPCLGLPESVILKRIALPSHIEKRNEGVQTGAPNRLGDMNVQDD